MASLFYKVNAYLEANGKSWSNEEDNIRIEDNGSGAVIKIWNVSGLTKPTSSQLNALEATADTDYANNRTRKTRKLAYGDIGDQLDEIFKDIDAWKARIQKIKTDNPKG